MAWVVNGEGMLLPQVFSYNIEVSKNVKEIKVFKHAQCHVITIGI